MRAGSLPFKLGTAQAGTFSTQSGVCDKINISHDSMEIMHRREYAINMVTLRENIILA
jgi:hypothetical protein